MGTPATTIGVDPGPTPIRTTSAAGLAVPVVLGAPEVRAVRAVPVDLDMGRAVLGAPEVPAGRAKCFAGDNFT